MIIVAALAKTQNQPGQTRQTQELQEQLFRTLRGLRFTGVLPPQLYDQILSEFNKARQGGSVGFAKFQHWLQDRLAQISSGSDQAQQASLKDIHATLKQARNTNDALVRGMQMFSSRSDKTAASLRALQRQAQVDLKALQKARDRLQTLLTRPEAASFPHEIHASMKQVNGWITTAQSFCRRLEKEIAQLPELGRERRQTTPPTVSGRSSGARVTHTNVERGGSVTGERAAKLEKKSREQYSQKLEQAAAWVYEQRRKGSSLSDAELCKQAAKKFFGTETHAGAIAKAVAGGGGGVQGAKGGAVRLSENATHSSTLASGVPHLLARHHMPLIHPNLDYEWARVMEDSVRAGVNALQANRSLPFTQILDTMIDTARPGLINWVSNTRNASWDSDLWDHTYDYGTPRDTDTRLGLIDGHYGTALSIAMHSLISSGSISVKTEDSKYALNLSQITAIHNDGITFSYHEQASAIQLGRLTIKRDSGSMQGQSKQAESKFILKHEAADTDLIPHILSSCDRIFDKVRNLKAEVDTGSREKNEANLQLTLSYAAEIYWLMSQAWPYRRGSSSIADLSTKVIFDWLGIEVPLFRKDVYPNINALLSPLHKFKADYPTFFQQPFLWRSK